jgi:hypothetical protein
MKVSEKAIEMLDLIDEVQSYNAGLPVIPMRPGMLFAASPGTALHKACERGLKLFGDDCMGGQFMKISRETMVENGANSSNATASNADLNAYLQTLYPGNKFNLPQDTLLYAHPVGYCVDPLQMAQSLQAMSKSYGVDVVEGRAEIDMVPEVDGSLKRLQAGVIISFICDH